MLETQFAHGQIAFLAWKEYIYSDLEVNLAGSVVRILLIILYILICTLNVTLKEIYLKQK